MSTQKLAKKKVRMLSPISYRERCKTSCPLKRLLSQTVPLLFMIRPGVIVQPKSAELKYNNTRCGLFTTENNGNGMRGSQTPLLVRFLKVGSLCLSKHVTRVIHLMKWHDFFMATKSNSLWEKNSTMNIFHL